MLEGVYDLTENRDFRNDIQDILSMKESDPDTLFKSPKIKKYSKYNVSYFLSDNQYSTTLSYNNDNWYNSILSYTNNQYDNYHIDFDWDTRTFHYDAPNQYYTTRNDAFTLVNNIMNYGLKLKSEKIPWKIFEPLEDDDERPVLKIRNCNHHGKYASWLITKRNKKYTSYSGCPECEHILSNKSEDNIPWNSEKEDKPAEEYGDYFNSSLYHDCNYLLGRIVHNLYGLNTSKKMKKIIDEARKIDTILPWVSTSAEKVSKLAKLCLKLNRPVQERIPWLKKMSNRNFSDYWEENIIENSDTQLNTSSMEKYLNMRPNARNVWS